MTKPHRFRLGRVSGFADEATSFVRRRRLDRQPFVRVHFRGGAIVDLAVTQDSGRRVEDAATELLERTARR